LDLGGGDGGEEECEELENQPHTLRFSHIAGFCSGGW
jgi:hypothetical protein